MSVIPNEQALNRPRIAIALATHEHVAARFAFDLSRLTMTTQAYAPEGTQLGVLMSAGTYVHNARQELVEALVGQGVTHILWIDSDMSFPPDALIRLLEHNVPVVGINYSHRGLPPDYVAIKRIDVPSEKLATTDDSTGLESVEAVGFGLVLTRIDALRKLPPIADGPWFNHEWLKDAQQWVGEDVYFCKLLNAAGVPILVDHDLSKECSHIGSFEYTLAGVAGWKEDA
jgi:hypothetical protein